jgi:hypothetical protein
MLAETIGTGNATHMGQFTTTAVACYLLAGGFSGPVNATLTSSNGDHIFLLLTDAEQEADGWAVNDFDIVGGTGRFLQATGKIVQRILLDHSSLTWIATSEGWISY